MCPMCKKATEFFLEEAKQKIDILFIPTVTLKSRYAVICSKCEQGEFCSDQWAVSLMNGNVPASVIFESEAQRLSPPPVVETEQLPTPSPSVPKETERQIKSVNGSGIPNFFKCAYCGVTQMREGGFCAYCGKPAPEEPRDHNQPERVPDMSPAPEICPSCGSKQPVGSKFCSSCGQPLSRQQPSKRVCPDCGTEAMDGVAFCMECGKRL